MQTNTSCTLYNRYEKNNGVYYQKTVLKAVFWDGGQQGGERGRQGGTGKTQKKEETGRVFIPFFVFAGGRTYCKPKEWDSLPDKSKFFTLRPGDYLVKGDCSGEYGPEHPIRYLAQEYDDVLTISTVSTRDFGSKEMQHWEIGGV